MDAPSTDPLSDAKLQSIIERLNELSVDFPAAAINEARAHAKEITPHLIKLIEDATRDCRLGTLDERYGHLFALYLLGEFRALEAWPAFRDALRLPDGQAFYLFTGARTLDYACLIHTLAGERVDEIDAIVADEALDFSIRSVAAETIMYRVRDGVVTKDEAIEWVVAHLERAVANQDSFAEGLVVRLEDLGAVQHLPLIKRAFAAGLIDEERYPFSEMEKAIGTVDEIFDEMMEYLQLSEELVDNLRRASIVDNHDTPANSNAQEFTFDFTGMPANKDGTIKRLTYGEYSTEDPKYVSQNDSTVRNKRRQVGRNEQCPCGSGKKYKKCCGKG